MERTRLINMLYAICIQDMNAEPVMRDMVEYSAEMTREDFCAEHLPNSEYMLELLEQTGMLELADDYRKLFPEWVRGE